MSLEQDPFEDFKKRRELQAISEEQKKQEQIFKAQQHFADEQKSEHLDRIVHNEMKDFFDESSRAAAKIFKSIHQAQEREQDEKVEGELQDFLSTSKLQTKDLLTQLERDTSLKALRDVNGQPEADTLPPLSPLPSASSHVETSGAAVPAMATDPWTWEGPDHSFASTYQQNVTEGDRKDHLQEKDLSVLALKNELVQLLDLLTTKGILTEEEKLRIHTC